MKRFTHEPAYQKIIDLQDHEASAFVVIDSYLGGGGTGGIRMGESVTLEEVSCLAHEMTLKFAWLNIARGGAKSGIAYTGELSAERKNRLLVEFGKSISGLLESHAYIPGMDLGVGPKEMAVIFSSEEIQAPVPTDNSDIDSNYFTALTVFVALKTLLEKRGERLSESRVLVEGVGKVGTHLMRLIDATGASIVGVSTIKGSIYDADGIDIEELLRLKEVHGDQCISQFASYTPGPSEDLYLQRADVLIPGARPNSINNENVDSIVARYVVPIANISASPEIETKMHDRGISYVPGFVSNSGGIFCWYLARLSGELRESIIRTGLAGKIRNLILHADRAQLPIAELARLQANKNADRMTREKSSSLNRAVVMAKKMAPRRSAYVVLGKLLGDNWASKDSVFCRWYFDARYFQ
ncbi:MAG: Glu/Leu/Phe/Val dehydrogenase dimerization domain-containing protein [Woeseiaceae bacterium]